MNALSDWSFFSGTLLVLFATVIVTGIVNKEYKHGSTFWFRLLVGMALLTMLTPLGLTFEGA